MPCRHVIGSMAREADDNGFEFILSSDIRRTSYVMSKLAGFEPISILLAATVSDPHETHFPNRSH